MWHNIEEDRLNDSGKLASATREKGRVGGWKEDWELHGRVKKIWEDGGGGGGRELRARCHRFSFKEAFLQVNCEAHFVLGEKHGRSVKSMFIVI